MSDASQPSRSVEEDAFWREVLLAQGASEDEVAKATAEGPLELYAVERFILGDVPEFDIVHASEISGVSIEKLAAFWRALGFPDPQPGEPTYSPSDIEMLSNALDFIDRQMLDETVAMQMARVIGSSLARVAVAQIEAADLHGGGLTGTASVEQLTLEEQAAEVQRSVEFIPMLSDVMQSVWRRHLATAARARILRSDDERERPITVGFADLEGFTSLSQQLPEHELAEVVNRFEQVAYDTVSQFPGARVVKMIGDEVMFSTVDVRSGAELALTLADVYGQDEALGDVRVGLATGNGLKLEGDLYGPAVNLASRIVSIAYPGSVVVPAEVYDALVDDPGYVFYALRPHHLRHIGRVKLWVLRHSTGEPEAEDHDGRTLRQAKERRATRRAWIADRMADHLSGLAAETAGDVTDRAVRRLVEGKATKREGATDELATPDAESETDST